MLKIEKIANYTIPLYGNKRIMPYGKLLVTDGINHKYCEIKDDEKSAKQYITFNRKRFYIKNVGTLYSPKFVICD